MTKTQFNIRLPDHLHRFLVEVTEARGVTKTDIIVDLLEASLEGRLLVQPRAGATAFPAHQVAAGTTPEYPVLIGL